MKIDIMIMKGKKALGNSLYINNFRVYGGKPWGGGDVLYRFQVDEKLIRQALKGGIEMKKPINHPEAIVLNHTLLMAQQSLCPEAYEGFVKVYNQIIKNRHLSLEPIKEINKELNTGKGG